MKGQAMRCKDPQMPLQEYLDGQLAPPQVQAVEAHLAACPACQQRLALLRQVDDALATWPLLAEPADFTARVMADVQQAASPLPTFRLRWEDPVASLAFAWSMAALLWAFSLLQPHQLAAAGAFLERLWYTWLPALDRLWQEVRIQPLYAVWGLFSLSVAAAAAASAVVLWRQWQCRPLAWPRRR